MENQNFFTIPYDKKYFPQIIELWKEQYDPGDIGKREKLFKWISTENPFMDDYPPYFLLQDNKRVVGMHGYMPLLFSIYGKKQRGYFAHDVLLSKDYRGKGLGRIILTDISKLADSFAGALWFNEPNYRLYKKSEWLDIPNVQSFVKISNPDVFLKEKIKHKVVRNIVSFIILKFLHLRNLFAISRNMKEVNIVEVDYFDNVIDTFFDKIAPQYGIMVARNHHYLNWKFVQKPFNNYKKFIAFDNSGELSGYIVMKSECTQTVNRGRILDFLVNPDKPEIFTALVEHCCNELNNQKVDYVQLTTSSAMIAGLAKKSGFIQARKPVRFMVKNWENFFKCDFVEKKDNWYITESDGDGDAWTVDSTKTIDGIE